MIFAGSSEKMTWLDLSGNKDLKELVLPEGFAALKYLHLSNCALVDLRIEGELPALRVLDVKENSLRQLPSDIILNSPLVNLYANGNSPKNIPWIFLDGDSLEDGRIWFEEFIHDPGKENEVVKLMITGNGGVGKTTLMCALQSSEERCTCTTEHLSTHGIQIGTWQQGDICYNYWDFGGQEVYHGTHQLFLQSEALHIIVFDPETEQLAIEKKEVRDRIREEEEIIHHPIQYWYTTNKSLSERSPFIILQNKKGLYPEKDKEVLDYAQEEDIEFLHVDAKEGDKIKILKSYLEEFTENYIPEYQMKMPPSWLRVRQYLIDNVENSGDTKHLIERGELIRLCDKYEVREKGRDLLFKYLHNSGYLYENKEILGDTIIADQRWALEAIYKPLDRRAKHYKNFRDFDKGQISVWSLFQAFDSKVDKEEEYQHQYSEEYKWLFLDFMKSCGLCFELNQGNEHRERSLSSIFIFPEFLPPEKPEPLTYFWQNRALKVFKFKYEMPWLQYFRVQTFISELGRKTELKNIWRFGIDVETNEGRFLVELDENKSAIILNIEASAMARWLKPILESLNIKNTERAVWEIQGPTDKEFKKFDIENWEKGLQLPEGSVDENEAILTKRAIAFQGEGKEASRFDAIPEVPSESKKEILLFLAAVPPGESRISYRNEYARLDEVLKNNAETRGVLELIPQFQVRKIDLVKKVKKERPLILHFVGHGKEEDPDTTSGGGLIFLSDHDSSTSDKLQRSEAKSIFEELKKEVPKLKIVFLNACYSEPIAKAISSAGLITVGADDKIGSIMAERFSEGFYECYAQTKDHRVAFKEGVGLAKTAQANASELLHLFENGDRVNLENL